MLENVDTTSDTYQSDYMTLGCAQVCPQDGKCDCNGPPPGCTTMADPDCTECRECRLEQHANDPCFTVCDPVKDTCKGPARGGRGFLPPLR